MIKGGFGKDYSPVQKTLIAETQMVKYDALTFLVLLKDGTLTNKETKKRVSV
jgi:hypothetical protein